MQGHVTFIITIYTNDASHVKLIIQMTTSHVILIIQMTTSHVILII